jgi:two-component system chemotaxis response regulator CheY
MMERKSKARILVVDDSSFMRGSLKFIAENAGHEVAGVARDGEEALERYRRLKPDIVTLDVLMEPVDGLTALEAIMTENPEAKVIMVTALGHEEKQEQARKLGASGYMRKPFKAEDVVKEIERVLMQSG